MSKKAEQFAPGSGCFPCGLCGRMTRSTGDGTNAELSLCPECLKLSYAENWIFDHDKKDVHEDTIKEVNELWNAIIAKGGKPRFCHMEYIRQKTTGPAPENFDYTHLLDSLTEKISDMIPDHIILYAPDDPDRTEDDLFTITREVWRQLAERIQKDQQQEEG